MYTDLSSEYIFRMPKGQIKDNESTDKIIIQPGRGITSDRASGDDIFQDNVRRVYYGRLLMGMTEYPELYPHRTGAHH